MPPTAVPVFDRAVFSGTAVQGFDAQGSRFQATRFTEQELAGASLREAVLSQTRLESQALAGCDLTGASLEEVWLDGCVFVSDDRKRIHLYRRQKLFANPVKEFEQCVDSGVALAHLELGARDAGYNPTIQRLYPAPKFKQSLAYQASVVLE